MKVKGGPYDGQYDGPGHRTKPQFDPVMRRWEADGIYYPEDDFSFYETVGWEKRAEPGDVVSVREFGKDSPELAKKEMLIVTVEGPNLTKAMLEGGMCESEWDLDTYSEYNPMDYNKFILDWKKRASASRNPRRAMQIFNRELPRHRKHYDRYIEMEKERCSFPKEHKKKRRFHMPLNDLASAGIDVGRMLNRNEKYNPRPQFQHIQFADKLKQRKILPTDGLRPIQPKEL
jgi:hypothetical protein